MLKKENMTDFVKHQELLNDIRTSINRIYADDDIKYDSELMEEMTKRTLEIIIYMDRVTRDLYDDPELDAAADEFNTTKEYIVQDIINVMLYSTIARQSILIEELNTEE